MKFCPKCEVKLKKDGSDLKCSKCGYIDGNTPTQQKKVVQEESTEAFNVFSDKVKVYQLINGGLGDGKSWKEPFTAKTVCAEVKSHEDVHKLTTGEGMKLAKCTSPLTKAKPR